jgi:hypothetical protein
MVVEPWDSMKLEPRRMTKKAKIPVPDEIRQVANNEDRKLAWYFFVFFSRMEYALKRSTIYLKQTSSNAEANWDKFASDYNDAFNPDASVELCDAVKYFLSKPPRKQLNRNGKLRWSRPQHRGSNQPLLIWLLRMVRCVRNNLFHGGKFPFISISDPSRDQELLLHSMVILRSCFTLDSSVKRLFLEGIDERKP